uniref:Homeobox domain-containing protein n=1 Tax=Aegilops tauschii subsp. strangulata TaxID=200361 RepID=A0A453LQM3_AEGTS
RLWRPREAARGGHDAAAPLALAQPLFTTTTTTHSVGGGRPGSRLEMAGAMVVHGHGGGGRDRDRDRSSPGGSGAPQVDTGKYVRYTPEQVDALERVYSECPKPSSLRRQQLIRECPILSNIEPKQIKVWFQNRRCREKQRKEASRLQTVNRKLSAMNKLLMEENDRLQKQVSRLVYENGYMRTHLNNPSVATTDTSCESVVTSGQHQQQQNAVVPRPQRDANNPAGLLAIAEETLAEFLSKATGTAVDWVQMVGMKPGPDSIGIIAVSHNCSGVAARACGLVSLEPTKVAEILKDRPSWYRDCRCVDVLQIIPTGNGGTIELIYMQTYAPTTLAAPRDFWILRYTSGLEDGSLVVYVRDR